MSYKIRNSIALGVLFLLVLAIGGYISMIYQPGKIEKYRKEVKRIESQLQDNAAQMSAISSMQNTLRETVHRWNNRVKEVAPFDISSQTYGYLSDVIDESGYFKLNMALAGSKSFKSYGYNIYKINGVSEFPNIFRFIWLLENGRKLYKISSVVLHSTEGIKEGEEYPSIDLTYDMEVHAYFTNTKELATPVARPDSTPQPITGNPFLPTIFRESPANVHNLLDVNTIAVKAVAAGRTLVMDPAGKLITLKIGDEVYLGKVSAILPDSGAVEFTLNNGGITEIVKKQIVFEKKLRGTAQ